MRSKFNQGVLSVNNLKNPVKYVGKQKMNIVFRSSWEISFFKWLDENPYVLEWSSEEHPIVYKSSIDNRAHRYFPDVYMKVATTNGKDKQFLVEIKPWHQTQKPKLTEGRTNKATQKKLMTFLMNQDKWAYAKEYCRKRGMKFIILTEKDILFKKILKENGRA